MSSLVLCSETASQKPGCFATNRISLHVIYPGIQHPKLPQDSKEETPALKRCWKPPHTCEKILGLVVQGMVCSHQELPWGPLMLPFQPPHKHAQTVLCPTGNSWMEGLKGLWKILSPCQKGGRSSTSSCRVWEAWTPKGYHIKRKDKACICYIPISEVEAVGRTVVAWRWSIVHLIRHIWPGRALLEEGSGETFIRMEIKDLILL